MKKFILPALLFAAVLTSCGNESKSANEAEEVVIIKNENTGTYNQIVEGTHIDWQAWHLGKTQERNGEVQLKEVEVLVNEGQVTNGKFVIDLTSLTVENFEDSSKNESLRGHLLSADFFMTDTFPTAVFEITSVDSVMVDKAFNASISGNLTIKNKTKNITFLANIEFTENEMGIISETFEINRLDWGLNYNEEGMAGLAADRVIANNMAFTIHSQIKK